MKARATNGGELLSQCGASLRAFCSLWRGDSEEIHLCSKWIDLCTWGLRKQRLERLLAQGVGASSPIWGSPSGHDTAQPQQHRGARTHPLVLGWQQWVPWLRGKG